jgi:hypothetical protein
MGKKERTSITPEASVGAKRKGCFAGSRLDFALTP